jgi:hypothetical protein
MAVREPSSGKHNKRTIFMKGLSNSMGTLVGDKIINYDYVDVFQEDYFYKLKGTRYWVLGGAGYRETVVSCKLQPACRQAGLQV